MIEKSKEIRPERFGDYYRGDEWKELFPDSYEKTDSGYKEIGSDEPKKSNPEADQSSNS